MGEAASVDPHESFLKRKAIPGGTPLQTDEYGKMLSRRAAGSSTPVAAELYNEFKSQILISDHSYNGTAHYNPHYHSIRLNAAADMQNPEGAGTTYYHEVGHMLDDFAGNGHAWLSSDPDYRAALEYDVSKCISDTMNTFGCSREEAYDIISFRLEGNALGGVSDIFGALTQCRCQGDWGHSVSYWQRNPTRVEKEAFADMFEASIGSPEKLRYMKLYFPTAYPKFENIIKYR